MTNAVAIQDRIGELCHQFRLPTMGAQSVSRFTAAGHGDALGTLLEVLEQEADDRRQRRTGRLRTASRLPAGKSWETFEHEQVPLSLQQQLGELAGGIFVERGVNALAFGLPGTGKTHALCAVGHRLVESGRSVLFAPAYRLVQDLLAAKRDLALPRQLRKLDNYDFLLLDDLGYLPQGAEESDVLFTLIAERYERRSLGITSNLVFSPGQSRFSCVGLLGGSPLASRPGGVCLGFPLSGWFPASAGCGRPASASPCSGGCGPGASGSGPPGM